MKLDELYKGYSIPKDVTDQIRANHPSISGDKKWDDENKPFVSPLEKWLKDKGWSIRVSQGYFSDVYINPNESYVLKINKRLDRGFAWFAFLTKKFPSKHFPKIGNVKQITLGDIKYYVYAIEHLQHTERAIALASVCQRVIEATTPEDEDDMLYELFYMKTESWLGDQQRSLFEACNILRKHRTYFRADMHFNNVMQRRDGTVVIIDPFGGVKK